MSVPLIIVTMKQLSPYKWALLGPTNKVMVDDVYCANKVKAEDWVKAYISTWCTWTYKLEVL